MGDCRVAICINSRSAGPRRAWQGHQGADIQNWLLGGPGESPTGGQASHGLSEERPLWGWVSAGFHGRVYTGRGGPWVPCGVGLCGLDREAPGRPPRGLRNSLVKTLAVHRVPLGGSSSLGRARRALLRPSGRRSSPSSGALAETAAWLPELTVASGSPAPGPIEGPVPSHPPVSPPPRAANPRSVLSRTCWPGSEGARRPMKSRFPFEVSSGRASEAGSAKLGGSVAPVPWTQPPGDIDNRREKGALTGTLRG